MLEARVNHLGAVQFEVKARNHKIYCDQRLENGGFDEGHDAARISADSPGDMCGFLRSPVYEGQQADGGRPQRPDHCRESNGARAANARQAPSATS